MVLEPFAKWLTVYIAHQFVSLLDICQSQTRALLPTNANTAVCSLMHQPVAGTDAEVIPAPAIAPVLGIVLNANKMGTLGSFSYAPPCKPQPFWSTHPLILSNRP